MSSFLKRYRITLLMVAVFLVLYVFTSRNGSAISQLSGYTMGTTYQLQFVDQNNNANQIQVQEDIQNLLDRLDRQVFSTYAPGSELSQFNAAPVDGLFVASADLIAVTQLALEISVLTNGAFDVTVGPLVNLWGFGPEIKPSNIPAPAAIEAARQTVGYQHLTVNAAGSWISKDALIYVDLSGIAKGYAVDQVAGYFDSIGVTNYFLEIGGEIKISGLKPGNQTWVPAVERPVDTAPQVYEILNSRGDELAIAGSGDYRNYFEEAGKRYSHEIDPRSGMPIDHTLAAVYVIDTSTARADALATAFMVLGYEEGMDLATSLGQAVYFIVSVGDGQFESYYTDQFMPYIDSAGVEQ
jgi:thiamine biosynthesis lipoprotein